MAEYNFKNDSQFSIADCLGVVGKNATLSLTGKIVDVNQSNAGAYVIFEVDKRWGLGGGKPFQLGLDLDALEVED